MQNSPNTYHIPALLRETIDLLDIKPDGVYIDATFGGGGHSRAILQKLGPQGHLYGFDRDIDALANVPDDPRFTFVHSDFRFMTNFMMFYGQTKVDGILADLGVSFHHFDTAERGFSFRMEAPLDMRMNRNSATSAKTIINETPEAELRAYFIAHTDLKPKTCSMIAKNISMARREHPIDTTTGLADLITPVLNPALVKKEMAQVFQALRIVTNDEMGSLRQLLIQSLTLLKPGGRLAVLTYHSGEDRRVKDFFKTGDIDGGEETDLIYGVRKSPWKLLTKSPVTASAVEVEENPRSRSAKLRVGELK